MSDARGELILGREDQLEAAQRFVADAAAGQCLVLCGDPGIGKTTLWEAVVERGRSQGYRVLLARASQAEATLLFAAMADLLDGAGSSVFESLPDPQRRALEVALHEAEPAGDAPEPFAIAVAFLRVVRLLAEEQPLLIAVDDVQWLDPSSAQALLFVARRIARHSDSRVRFLLCRRAGRRTALERALERAGLLQLEIDALSFGAISRLLYVRLGLGLPRRVQREVYLASHGNPLFALELGRLLAERESAEIGAELPVPDLHDDIFGERVRGLDDSVRRALLAADLSADVSVSQLTTFTDPLVLEDAIAGGLLVVERSRVRPSHPLLGAAVRLHSTARERRSAHLALASAVEDATLQARHLALATAGEDARLAARITAACAVATGRGASYEAEELAAQALRLTPRSDDQYRERLLLLAQCHLAAGDLQRAGALLGEHLAEFTAGPELARAHLLLGEAADGRSEEQHLRLALAETPDDSELRAVTLTRRAILRAMYKVERLEEAEAFAGAAMEAAPAHCVDLRQDAVTALAWVRVMRGRQIDDLRSRAQAHESEGRLSGWPEDRPFGVQLAFRGELAQARTVFSRLLRRAVDAGDVRLGVGVSVQLCELELRAGDLTAAGRVLEELDGWTALTEIRIATARLHSLHAALRGDPDDTARWAGIVALAAEDDCPTWDRLEAVRARGIAALLAEDWSGAARLLMSVWDYTVSEGIDDPGAFPVAADLVEALVLQNDADSAGQVCARLVDLAAEQSHPWGTVTAERCAGTLRQAGDLDAAADVLLEAAAGYLRLGFGFDRARTLLFVGRALRRAGKKAAARSALVDAEAAFAAAGSGGWAAAAHLELSRVSGRRPGSDSELTPSELRVAQLAAQGLANKEIAAQLFVSVYTVEAHLSHAYAKLGVRSRAELSRHFAGVTPASPRP